MFKINVCRVCLGDDTTLYRVTNTNYQEMYEKLTSTKLEDGLPQLLCYFCYLQLRKCMKFAKTALKSYKLLLQWTRCGTVVTKPTLSNIESLHRFKSTPVEVLSIDSETGTIDNEIGTIEEIDVKLEHNNTKEVPEIKKLKCTKDALKINHSLFFNDKSLNDTSVQEETPSLLRHLLTNDKSLNDKVADDKSLNDKVFNDNSLNDKVFNDNSLNDRVFNDNSLNDRVFNDNSLNDRVFNDNSLNDRVTNDKSLNDRFSKDKSSLLRHLLESNDKSTNDKSIILNNLIFLNDKSVNDVSNDIPLVNGDESSVNLLNNDFSSSDDEFLSSFKPKLQKKGQLTKNQFKKLNVTVVRVDTSRQRQDMTSRTQSDNYIHSEYKCDYCYRGFSTCTTFTKHMYKHSEEKSGKYECDICHYRYRIISKLRIHIENSHSRFYKCNICGAMLHSLFQAKIHNREHQGFKYTCQLCSKEFNKRTSYFSHVRMKHASKHICKICGKSFVSSMGVLQHVSKVHRGEITRQESSSNCYDCDLNFVSIDALYRHRLDSPRHKAAWQHSTTCFVCHEDLKNKILLKKHLKEHRDKLFYNYNRETRAKNIVIWKCDECSKVFNQKSNLRVHIKRKHLDLKINFNKDKNEDFICEICGVKLKSKGSLTSHRRIHTGERPYLCTSCPKSFNEKSQLNLHSRTHTGYRPYNCEQCCKKFTQKTALNRHMRTHTGAKPYTCQVCLKQFTQSNSLKGHIARVHFKLPSYKQKMKEEDKIGEKDCQINEINV